jgi:hypothetical protein
LCSAVDNRSKKNYYTSFTTDDYCPPTSIGGTKYNDCPTLCQKLASNVAACTSCCNDCCKKNGGE